MPFGFTRNSVVLAALRQLQQQGNSIMSALDDLKAADAKLGTSVAVAIATIAADTKALAERVAASDDSADLAALAADLNAKAAALDAAVNPPTAGTANPTPAGA